jgi:ABC-type nitrate/sulfonate/bicarbonate transport system substrate-binding protein
MKYLILYIAAASFLILTGCNSDQKPETAVKTLTVGIQNSPSNSLVIVAAQKQFFDTTKLKVTVREFSAGKLALQALLSQAGDLDVAVCAETPVVLSSMGNNVVRVISQIVNAKNECRVVVQKDKDLDTPAKYFSKKRRLATSQGGSPEWITYNFINKYKLDRSKIDILAMLPENMPAALSSNAVDGISIFDPFARMGEKQLGDKGLTFTNSDITSYYVLTVKENTITQKGGELAELIKGLQKAADFIRSNPEEAKKIVAASTKLDIALINETWADYDFSLGLDSSLIDLCKAEAAWAIDTKKYPATTAIPDFGKIVDAAILKRDSSKGPGQ